MEIVLSAEILLKAYTLGLFPMAYNADSPYVHWLSPELRGQLSIEALHVPKSLKKLTRKNLKRDGLYQIRVDHNFAAVLDLCAQARDERPETWINDPIKNSVLSLYEQGYAHSVECWRGEKLVGGLYGIAIGGAFFGESMFSLESNTSKLCLVHLAARLWQGGFTLLDAQFVNDHLKQFGIYEVPKEVYKRQLEGALEVAADFKLEGWSEEALIKDYFENRNMT